MPWDPFNKLDLHGNRYSRAFLNNSMVDFRLPLEHGCGLRSLEQNTLTKPTCDRFSLQEPFTPYETVSSNILQRGSQLELVSTSIEMIDTNNFDNVGRSNCSTLELRQRNIPSSRSENHSFQKHNMRHRSNLNPEVLQDDRTLYCPYSTNIVPGLQGISSDSNGTRIPKRQEVSPRFSTLRHQSNVTCLILDEQPVRLLGPYPSTILRFEGHHSVEDSSTRVISGSGEPSSDWASFPNWPLG